MIGVLLEIVFPAHFCYSLRPRDAAMPVDQYSH
jgi:hypothetical protein